MSQKEDPQVITFRIPPEIAEEVEVAGRNLPRMAGQTPPSIHQYARAFMIRGLEAYLEAEAAKEGE